MRLYDFEENSKFYSFKAGWRMSYIECLGGESLWWHSLLQIVGEEIFFIYS